MDIFPNFAEEGARKDTFYGWPSSIDSKIMSQSGFFFLGQRDIVQCFSCGIRLSCWKISDTPDDEHLQYSPQCLYIQRKILTKAIKGLKLVYSLLKKLIDLNTKLKKLEQFIHKPVWTISNAGEMEIRCYNCMRLQNNLNKRLKGLKNE